MTIKFASRLASAAALLVLLLSSVLAASAASQGALPQSTTMTFTAKADAVVKSSSPSSNYGTGSLLQARTSPTVHGYLRFSVSGLNGAPVTAAKLRLYTKTGTA